MKKRKQIPKRLKPIFWSYDFDSLDSEEDRVHIIKQIINYGDLEDWKWLLDTYGESGVKTTLEAVPVTEIKPSTRRLLEVLLNVKLTNHAPRSFN